MTTAEHDILASYPGLPYLDLLLHGYKMKCGCGMPGYEAVLVSVVRASD